MTKLRVSDLAAEFGISSDEVLGMLRAMDVVVRSHLTPLTDDQISRARARWEREKRVRAQKSVETPSAAAKSRRRGSAAAESAPEPAEKAEKKPASAKSRAKKPADAPAPAPEPADAHKVRRRRAAPPVPEPAPEPVVVEAPPVEAAPVAAPPIVEPASAPPVEAPKPAPVVSAPPVAPAPAPADTTAASSAPAPVTSPAPAAAAGAAPASPPPAPAAAPVAAPSAPPRPARPLAPPAPPSAPAGAAPQGERPRPRPVVPGAPRGRPAAAGARNPMAPRPIASAAPGGGLSGGRREDRGRGPSTGGSAAPQTPSSGPRRKKGKRGQVDQEAVSSNISRTMREMRGAPGKRRRDDSGREELEAIRAAVAEQEKKTVHVNEFITVSELADILKIPATQIVSFAFKHLGLMVTINQRMDFDQIELIAGEFGFIAVREAEYAAAPTEAKVEDTPEQLSFRPPVVTIMGHVDHGKTSLLDYIRKANVVAGEAGGITQHIGAYHVTLANGKHITFLDTPGHQAFTAMRARGAQVTDIVVLVVAADDSVMPQTIEAISHARNAGVPMIVAINKIDLPAANALKVKQELLNHSVVLEEFGGQVLHTEVSAKKGTGVPALLDQLLLQAEILDLKANPNRKATGAVVEAQLDAGKGPVATVLVQNGTLRVGDDFICGLYSGRVRALLDERGKAVKEAGPAIPVQVLGLTGVPMAGDQFIAVADASEAREIAQRRERLDREAKSRRTAKGAVSLEDFMSQAGAGEKRSLKLLIKADQGGPAEALADALQQLSNEEVQVEVVQRSVGAITESDILLAKASGAIIVGFHVRPDNKARQMAEREGVDIKLYKIIYEAVADVKLALEGLLRPEEKETVLGEAEVREVFKVSKVGVIAGCSVRHGIINRQAKVRVVRDGVEVYSGNIGSLRRFKDDVKEVKEGFECGIGVESFNDIKVGDVLECFRMDSVARTLQPAHAS
ncbi:MAG: translation initiation factor IF-2 [Gemmatimonadaceae bacterium]